MVLVVEVGCYVCPDHPPGERWFTALPTEYQGGVQYDALTRSKVISLVQRTRISDKGDQRVTLRPIGAMLRRMAR